MYTNPYVRILRIIFFSSSFSRLHSVLEPEPYYLFLSVYSHVVGTNRVYKMCARYYLNLKTLLRYGCFVRRKKKLVQTVETVRFFWKKIIYSSCVKVKTWFVTSVFYTRSEQIHFCTINRDYNIVLCNGLIEAGSRFRRIIILFISNSRLKLNDDCSPFAVHGFLRFLSLIVFARPVSIIYN